MSDDQRKDEDPNKPTSVPEGDDAPSAPKSIEDRGTVLFESPVTEIGKRWREIQERKLAKNDAVTQPMAPIGDKSPEPMGTLHPYPPYLRPPLDRWSDEYYGKPLTIDSAGISEAARKHPPIKGPLWYKGDLDTLKLLVSMERVDVQVEGAGGIEPSATVLSFTGGAQGDRNTFSRLFAWGSDYLLILGVYEGPQVGWRATEAYVIASPVQHRTQGGRESEPQARFYVPPDWDVPTRDRQPGAGVKPRPEPGTKPAIKGVEGTEGSETSKE